MFHKPVSGLAGIVIFLCCASIAPAQDFHVTTQIYDVQDPPQKTGKGASKGGVLSLFHAGKGYDLARNSKEVTIFEPALERFSLIDDSRNLKTSISFDEVAMQLAKARAELQAFLDSADEQKVPREIISFYKFQLDPKFEVRQAARKNLPIILEFSSPYLEYEVVCAQDKSAKIVETYLDYADGMARLNFVFLRQKTLPDPRIAVNAELRKRKLLPVKITLTKKIQEPLHIRSEHDFTWELTGSDKTEINRWDNKLTAKSYKEVTWKEYRMTTFQDQVKK